MVIPPGEITGLDALRLSRACGRLPFFPRAISSPSLDARKGPSGRFGDDRLSRSCKPFQKRTGTSMNFRALPQIGISQRIAGVAHQPAPFGALNGAASEHFPEFSFAQTREPFEPGQKETLVFGERCIGLFLSARRKNSWLEFREGRDRRSPVPRANVLANIAAKNMTSHRPAKLLGNALPQFDRQIGDAPSCIHHVGFDECIRRTSIQALTAIPAEVRRWQLICREARRQVEGSEDDAQEKEGTKRFVQQQRIFPEPAQARMFCEDAFLHGTGVYVGPRYERFGKMLTQRAPQPVQAIPQHVMIVASPGVPGNPAAGLVMILLQGGFCGKWMRRVVVEQAGDNASDRWQGALRVGSPGIRKILHLTPVSASQPFRDLRQLWKTFCADYSAAVEANSFRPFHDPLCFRNVIHPAAHFITKIVPQTWVVSELGTGRD